MRKPEEVIAVFDAGESVIDRYTVVLKEVISPDYPHIREGIAVSSNPDSPQGVCLWTEVHYWEGDENEHLGKRISWKSLPENVREAVVRKISGEV